MKKEKIDINELIFRYKWWIGSILLILIILSGGYLLWRESYGGNAKLQMSNDKQVEDLEARSKKQEARIGELESSLKNQETSAASQTATTADTGQVAGASTSSSAKTTKLTGKINLNTASSAQLDTLPGIGTAYAQRIIEYRASHGGFKNISELKNVKGIGDKTFDKLKDLITL